MCIIAYYSKGLELNKDELRECFVNNPDGAGMMYQTEQGVHVEKGYMSFKDFWETAKKLPNNIDRVFHFRIATSGKISGACCHPFPITADYKKMSMVSSDCKRAFAHNGVLAEFTPKDGMASRKSDTMVFNHMVLDKLGYLIENEAVRDLIELYTVSRFAIMTKDTVYTIGTWDQSRESGAWYSNETYEPYVPYWSKNKNNIKSGVTTQMGTLTDGSCTCILKVGLDKDSTDSDIIIDLWERLERIYGIIIYNYTVSGDVVLFYFEQDDVDIPRLPVTGTVYVKQDKNNKPVFANFKNLSY